MTIFEGMLPRYEVKHRSLGMLPWFAQTLCLLWGFLMPSFASTVAKKLLLGPKQPLSENREKVIDDVLRKLDPCNREQVLAAHREITRMGKIDELWDTYIRGGTKAQSLDAAAKLILFWCADKEGATLDDVLGPREAAQRALAENLSPAGRDTLKQSFVGNDENNVFSKYFAPKDRECLDRFADQGDIECDTADSINASFEKDASADMTAVLANPHVDGFWQSWATEKKLKVADELWTHARECEKEGSFREAAGAYVCGAQLFDACGHRKSAAELYLKAAMLYAGCYAKTHAAKDAEDAIKFMKLAAEGLVKAGWSQRAALVIKELKQFCARSGLSMDAEPA